MSKCSLGWVLMVKFDLAALRVSQDLEPATRPDFGFIRLGKPNKRVFIRTFHIPAQSETYWLLDDVESEVYIVTPDLALELGSDAYPACLVPYVTRDHVAGIWPIKVGRSGAKPNSWNVSAYHAAQAAEENWVRVQSNMAMSCYDIRIATGTFEEPLYPNESYDALVGRAFDGRVIDSTGHPTIQKLLGAL
jgi:hypothetical protein